MADYLTQALAARAQSPEQRRGLVQAMARRQGRGAALGALTQGRLGQQLQRGPSPTEMLVDLEEQARQRALQDAQLQRQAERDRISDEQWQQQYDLNLIKAARTGQIKPSAKERQNYAANQRALSRIDQIRQKTMQLSPEGAAELDSPWYEITSRVLPDSVRRRADEAFYSPESEEILKIGSQIESDIRRAFAGTAVTKYEQQDTQEWSPMAPGLSQDQRQARWGMIERDLMEAQALYGEMYPNYVTETPTVQAPQAETRVIEFGDLPDA